MKQAQQGTEIHYSALCSILWECTPLTQEKRQKKQNSLHYTQLFLSLLTPRCHEKSYFCHHPSVALCARPFLDLLPTSFAVMLPRVKICGITHQDDAHRCLQIGASMLGIVFAPRSKRYLSPEAAKTLVRQSSPTAIFVGVFVDEAPKTILDIAKTTGLKKIQLQGSETPEVCRELNKTIPTIKAFRVDSGFMDNPQQPERYMETEAHLFDSKIHNIEGGSGQAFDWHLLESIPRCRPRILAGGLDEHNIADAIAAVRPDVVDLSSSVARDDDPRRKDVDKMARFFSALERL